MNTAPCCDNHDFAPYSEEWYGCIDNQPDEAESTWYVDEPEYIMADEAYDLRGGATSDYEWYGGYMDAY